MEEEHFIPDYDESGIGEDEIAVKAGPVARRGSTKRKKGNVCSLCGGKFTHLHRHVLQTHLPWFFQPTTSCWTCKKQFCQLNFILRHLQSEHGDTYDRASFTEEQQLKTWVSLMVSFFVSLRTSLCLPTQADMLRESKTLDCDIYQPLGNILKSTIDIGEHGELLHWRSVLSLLEQLSPEAREGVRSDELEVNQVHRSTGTTIMADSHFHLDVLLQRTGCAGLAEVAPKTSGNLKLTVAVANYCWPKHWPLIIQMRDEIVRFSVGIHPKAAVLVNDRSWFHQLKKYASSGKISAIGECGLDSTQQDDDVYLSHQQYVLEQQLHIARENNLPVIIHCRGPRQLADRCLSVLQKGLDKAHKVHFHCFSGDIDQVRQWSQAFPSLLLGISPLIFRPKVRDDVVAVVRSLPLNKIILETDSPYLAPSPYHIPKVAAEVARQNNIPMSIVLQTTARNTEGFYKMGRNVVLPGRESE